MTVEERIELERWFCMAIHHHESFLKERGLEEAAVTARSSKGPGDMN
jgi:hypothetical protein